MKRALTEHNIKHYPSLEVNAKNLQYSHNDHNLTTHDTFTRALNINSRRTTRQLQLGLVPWICGLVSKIQIRRAKLGGQHLTQGKAGVLMVASTTCSRIVLLVYNKPRWWCWKTPNFYRSCFSATLGILSCVHPEAQQAHPELSPRTTQSNRPPTRTKNTSPPSKGCNSQQCLPPHLLPNSTAPTHPDTPSTPAPSPTQWTK